MSTSRCLKEAYGDTLARIHVWVVKKAVHFAFNLVAERKKFLETVNISEEKLKLLAPKYIEACQYISTKIESQFKENEVQWIF